MKQRIFNHWKTSIFGLVILIFAGALTWSGRTNLESFMLTLPVVATWLYFKDPEKKSDTYNGPAK